ncbi:MULTISPECIES: hypothetical protein [unclassified Pseudomonas]|jgi:hypothetical protein|uniref:hypothetical protein n=1 Tax=unclassified Pseudomonas TaxID=196821 RepID=UPI0002726DDB|nr:MULTISPECIES: hypothetical protein [unclassified Pseudomonas]EJL99295.1 hypothetical protein PMI19_04151 [Pseudomonas sp. GM16]EJM31080.1 hypothetical protein PMI23_04544 [Pseudomonas sp. GM24]
MPKIVSTKDLHIYLADANEAGLFKCFVACFLMGKRIQADTAVQAYRVNEKKGPTKGRFLITLPWRSTIMVE